jgi:hypothetical protein
MTPTESHELQPWLDPNDLVRSIVAIGKEEVATVAKSPRLSLFTTLPADTHACSTLGYKTRC